MSWTSGRDLNLLGALLDCPPTLAENRLNAITFPGLRTNILATARAVERRLRSRSRAYWKQPCAWGFPSGLDAFYFFAEPGAPPGFRAPVGCLPPLAITRIAEKPLPSGMGPGGARPFPR